MIKCGASLDPMFATGVSVPAMLRCGGLLFPEAQAAVSSSQSTETDPHASPDANPSSMVYSAGAFPRDKEYLCFPPAGRRLRTWPTRVTAGQDQPFKFRPASLGDYAEPAHDVCLCSLSPRLRTALPGLTPGKPGWNKVSPPIGNYGSSKKEDTRLTDARRNPRSPSQARNRRAARP